MNETSILLWPVDSALRHWRPLAALSWLVSGALYLTLPPSPDQFNHAYLGWRLLEGDIPYRDVIDMNWPGVMALQALATWIFGNNLWSWRAFDFALFAASTLFLSDLVRLAAGRDAGRITLILCPLIYAGVSYGLAGQHDMSAAQFLVGALWFHVRGYERRTWWYQIGAGVFIGAAMLNKPTVGVIGVLLPLQALWFRIPILRIIAYTATAGVAAVVTLVVAMGAVLARGTSWGELVDAIYTYNIVTGRIETLPEMAFWLLHFHYRWIPMAALGAIPAVFWIVARANRSMAATALLVLWAAGVLSFFIQWHGLAYHLAPSLIALCGVLAISVALVADGRMTFGKTAWKQRIIVGAVALSLAGIGLKLAWYYRTLPPAFVSGDYGPHFSRFDAGGEVSFADVLAFVRRLEALPPTDCVLHVGDVTSINYLSRRRMPTRFYYYHVLKLAPMPMAERWIDLWETDLQAADCRFTLVSRSVDTEWLHGPGRAAAALRRFLAGYRESAMIGTRGGIVVYERL